MASQPGNSPSASATATLVGNAFVSQYYNVLHLSSHNVHRFYTDQSKLSRAEVGTNADIVETQDKIQEKISSMNLDGVQAQIKTVDSLASLNGSVLVMVTGVLSSRTGLHRNFVQTFFLAPQEKGYFVLSDICRFLDGEGEHVPEEITVPTAVEQENEVSPPPFQEEVSEYPTSLEVESDSRDVDIVGLKEQMESTAQDTSGKDDVESLVNAPSPQEPVVEEAEEQVPAIKVESTEGAAKMSYASILREASGAPFANRQVAPPRRVAPSQAAPAPPTTASHSLPQETTGSSAIGVPNDGAADGGDGHSVYVKNLPLNIVQEDLEKEFQKFGSVKPGGVNLRNQKQGVCFAFIQFEDASSVQNAIEASPISIGGRQVYIEEKKPTTMGPSGGRGRSGQGRGYQAEGMNGRGHFGGRNFGRGGFNSERDFSSRGRGGRGSSGTSGNFVNGYRRGENQVGSGPRPVRRGASDQ